MLSPLIRCVDWLCLSGADDHRLEEPPVEPASIRKTSLGHQFREAWDVDRIVTRSHDMCGTPRLPTILHKIHREIIGGWGGIPDLPDEPADGAFLPKAIGLDLLLGEIF